MVVLEAARREARRGKVSDQESIEPGEPGEPGAPEEPRTQDGELVVPEGMYAVLGVSVNATTEEVHHAYRRLVLLHHPDRNPDPEEAQKFHLITTAGSVLRDRYRRMMYDIQLGLRPVPQAEIRDVSVKLRTRAMHLVENMTETVAVSRETEASVNGVVILKGLYGDLRHRGDVSLLPATVIDVTAPLQYMVHSSELVNVSKTKMFLDGFYDPCMYQDKQLFVRYMFKGAVHQVVYEDKDPIHIPLRSHLIHSSDLKEEYLYQTKFTFPRRSRAERRRLAEELRQKQRLVRSAKWAVSTLILIGGVFVMRDSQHIGRVIALWRRAIRRRH